MATASNEATTAIGVSAFAFQGTNANIMMRSVEELGDFLLLDSVHQIANGDIRQLTVMVVDETERGIPVGYRTTAWSSARPSKSKCWKSSETSCYSTASTRLPVGISGS